MFSRCSVIALILTASLHSPLIRAADDIGTSGGRPLSDEEIGQWQLTVFPNGRNLPAGSGSVEKGEQLYKARCIGCHGMNGQNGMGPRLAGNAGFVDDNKDLMMTLSVGAWPNATAIFDYIRRGMPHHAPKTLSDDDVYALTAYILNLNEIVERNTVLNKASLMRVVMPNQHKTVNIWEQERQKPGEICKTLYRHRARITLCKPADKVE